MTSDRQLCRDKLAHRCFEAREVAFGEGSGEFEIVIKAGIDDRADAEFCLREFFQHRHREEMGEGVTDVIE